jgi:hypothetical protein
MLAREQISKQVGPLVLFLDSEGMVANSPLTAWDRTEGPPRAVGARNLRVGGHPTGTRENANQYARDHLIECFADLSLVEKRVSEDRSTIWKCALLFPAQNTLIAAN